MVDTNYISGIVKILENPKKIVIKNNTTIVKFRGQLSQIRNSVIVNLVFWGNFGQDIGKYYKTNDYILIEGYLSLCDKKNTTSITKASKKIEITVLKVYPFLLSYDSTINRK